jgi:hypothetical protein
LLRLGKKGQAAMPPHCATWSAGKDDGMRGVQTFPGDTPFTLIPLPAKDLANDLVKDTIAPFAHDKTSNIYCFQSS